MTLFFKNSNHKSINSNFNNSLIKWVTGNDIFSSSVNPRKRIKKILIEIQKRSLAEQIFLLNWNKRKEQKILCMAPAEENPIINSRLQLSLLKKGFVEKSILFYDDFSMDDLIKEQLKKNNCQSIIFSPVNIKKDYIDVLLIINYSDWRDKAKITEFVSFISSVLSFAMQNVRLFTELKKKNQELYKWTINVEERIKEGTKKLLEKEAQYYSLFNGTDSGIIVHNMEGKIIEVNTAACNLFGYKKDRFLLINWKKLSLRQSGKIILDYFMNLNKSTDTELLQIVLEKADGTKFFAELRSRNVRFQSQKVIQTFINNITHQKEMERILKDSKEKYRILVESSVMGVYIVQNGVIKFINTMFMNISGYNEKDLLEKKFSEFIDPEDRGKIISLQERVENGNEKKIEGEIRLIKENKDRCWCELHLSSTIFDKNPAVIGNMIDITERKNLELQLLETQKLESLGTLAGGIAHDFNNLLGGILGYASLMLCDITEDHPFYNDIQAIAETSKRAADLSNRLLAFARGGKYQVAQINMNKLVEDVVTILSHTIDKSVIIKTDFEDEIWLIYGDSRQIHQAIHNICLNARDVMPDGGKFSIKTENVFLGNSFKEKFSNLIIGDYVKISIADTGPGMDEKTKSRIFEPFFTTKATGEGTGLGMSMVYGIVKNHKGYIDIYSEIGNGTEVTIFLPRSIKTNQKYVEEVNNYNNNSNLILLVDDEEVIREVGKRMLNKGGFRVLTAENGIEALKIFKKKENDISLVIIDVIMPKMGGQQTYTELKKIDPDIKVIFTSGYGPEDRPDLIQLNGEYFVKKPFQTQMFIEKIREILSDNNTN